MIIPNLFIVGSWKAGTSSLYQYLSAHPEIFMSPVKEPHYFVRHSRFRPRIFWRKSSYLRLFRNAGNAKIVGEASAYYLSSPESAAMIHDFNPQAKIIIMLRHPVEVIHAFYTESVFLGREERSFAEALLEQKQYPDHPQNYVNLIRAWPERIARYRALFGEKNVHVMLLEDLAKRPEETYRKVLEFLGVGASFLPEFKIYNPSKIAPSEAFKKLSGSRITVFALQIASISALLAERIEHFRKGQLRLAERPPLDPAIQQELKDAFSPTIDRLSELLHTDLSHWK